MSMIFFTSDTHFGHRKLALHRGFEDPDVMNVALIERWNAKVKKDDTVYHLGDFSFLGTKSTIAIMEQLNGKVFLVPGNHDKGMTKHTLSWFAGVLGRMHTLKIPHGDDVVRVELSHHPQLVWDRAHYGSWHLHGHSHGNLRFPNPNARILDVGVDSVHGLAPISFGEVVAYMKHRSYKSFDQHEETNELQ